MSEEAGDDGISPEGVAAWAALAAAGREKADAFLDEQTQFVRLQKEHLHEQRMLPLSHPKWRRFAIAARLDLAPDEKVSLEAWMKTHG
jgi:hypothetical protein